MHARSEKMQLAIWALAAVLLALAAYRLLGEGEASGGSAPIRVDGPGAADPAAPRGPSAWVHVAGAVRRPGLYRVRADARVGVAVRRAGGHTGAADLTRINLAARVSDGQQVIVPRRGAAAAASGVAEDAAAGAAGAAAGGAPGERVSLATATAEQLDSLDGIGPTLARRIVEHRDGGGSVETLREVEGIGDKRFEALRRALGP